MCSFHGWCCDGEGKCTNIPQVQSALLPMHDMSQVLPAVMPFDMQCYQQEGQKLIDAIAPQCPPSSCPAALAWPGYNVKIIFIYCVVSLPVWPWPVQHFSLRWHAGKFRPIEPGGQRKAHLAAGRPQLVQHHLAIACHTIMSCLSTCAAPLHTQKQLTACLVQSGHLDATMEQNACNSSRCRVASYPTQVKEDLVWVWGESGPSAFIEAHATPLACNKLIDTYPEGVHATQWKPCVQQSTWNLVQQHSMVPRRMLEAC